MTGRHGPHANHHVQHAPKPPPLVHAPKGTGSHAAPQDVHSNHHGQPVHPEQRYPHGTTGHATHGHGAQHPYPYQRIENMSIGHPHPPGSHTAVPHPEGTGHVSPT